LHQRKSFWLDKNETRDHARKNYDPEKQLYKKISAQAGIKPGTVEFFLIVPCSVLISSAQTT
jgi:hypothetical protein